jgi:DNA-binding beta-propeller fold protein YncE
MRTMRWLFALAFIVGCGDDMPPPPTEPTVLATSLATPIALALDADFVYVANAGDGSIVRVRKDGTSRETFAITAPGLQGIAVDAQGVYVTNDMQGTVSRIVAGSPPQMIAGGLDHPTEILAVPSGVYWLNRGSTGGATGSVMALLPSGSLITVASNQPYASGLALGGPYAYWVLWREGSIWRTDISGGTPQQLLAPSGEFLPVDIGLSGDRLYIAGIHFGVSWIPASGGALTQLTPAASDGGYSHVVVAGSHVYLLWQAIPRGAGPDAIFADSQKLVGDLPQTLALAVDDLSVYWIEAGPQGALLKAPR